ncbi:MAG: hypothetical protein UR66_C0003G0139 [Candidatus Moranbacteria bacterium GW2011_GWE1_35_17]|nr:MAG: hypothetical protein UR66_C0003G0139 [Candidatus Moranbacteria bacterium GW2011_GWE1_35_17]KKP72529.1 MAG: hypothetical protein UR65_C0014G0042 [Candidatus Moranbacteria bacterium GW2011_GWE2_35_164]KKP84585.1 MAG: hypothetical protein UR82_C0002G0002 [Candidatus Moranbacteria bacterium GW2011_GWF1_35_5]
MKTLKQIDMKAVNIKLMSSVIKSTVIRTQFLILMTDDL